MSKLYSIGELIIDFQSVGLSKLKDTREFVKNPGGAPANVCVQVAKNGHSAVYISKVGRDAFGDFLIETLEKEQVDTSNIQKSDEYQTSLAFVSFLEDGDREFSFFRKAAADLYFTKEDVEGVSIADGDILHFGSVALKTPEARQAHDILIEKARNAIITFDPNVRLNLWESHEELRSVINAYVPCADVLKISDDELPFITGIREEGEAIGALFRGNVKLILLTRGKHGATLYTKNGTVLHHNGYAVKSIDTTGAGDSFFGGFISKLLERKLTKATLLDADYTEALDFASRCGAYTTTKYGAISAMGNQNQIEMVVNESCRK